MRTALVLVIVAMLSACSADDPPPPGPGVPGFAPSNAAPTPVAERTVPKTCGGIATLDQVVDILGTAVTGQTLPIVGVPEPKIGRTARLDCYYGVPDGQQVSAANVWIGLASYTDEAAAKTRVDNTVAAEREAGAKPVEVPVGPGRGTLLTGQKHTLVAAQGKLTVVVTVLTTIVPADQADTVLATLADRALHGP